MKKEDELFNKAREIATKIGDNGVRSIGLDRHGYDILAACKIYKYDRLHIYDSGQIYYDGDLVFDKKIHRYVPNFWEELFDELYDVLDILEEEKKEKEAEVIAGKMFYDNYFRHYKNLDEEEKDLYDGLLKIRGITASVEEKLSDDYQQQEGHYKVFKNDICVYNVAVYNYKMNINKFVNSSWAREFAEVREAIEQMKEMKKEKEQRESVEESLQKLKIKKSNRKPRN